MITEPVRMDALNTGDHFVGPDGRREYAVTQPCRDNEHGFLFVYELGYDIADDDRGGFFSYATDTLLERITGR